MRYTVSYWLVLRSAFEIEESRVDNFRVGVSVCGCECATSLLHGLVVVSSHRQSAQLARPRGEDALVEPRHGELRG